MMKCAVMQPTYLPWAGYFNLIASVDVFVFLDDVQFERRSWQSRNRILLGGCEYLLTVPVKKASREELVCRIEVDANQDWTKRHLDLLRDAYRKAPFCDCVLEVVESVFSLGERSLSRLNARLIQSLAGLCGIQCRFLFASELGCGGHRSRHLEEICHAVKCEQYLSPVGSRDYLMADGFGCESSISLSFQDFMPMPYAQVGTLQFVSHLSLVDVIAHLGPDAARGYCRSQYVHLDGQNDAD